MSSHYSRAALADAMDAGHRPEFLFFWGHTSKSDAPGKHCLSQWWPAAFTVDAVSYPTAEHFMMAEKARLFADPPALALILGAGTPREAKQLGRRVRGFDGARWEAARFELVVRGNAAKFGQNPLLREYLLGTGGSVIVEASPRDRIWGIGMGESNPNARSPRQWRGQNLLGFALMRVRDELRRGR
ncbi:MAG TPA: NADAR family protein [Myxococcota bacterium]|nr:NADAR family protein [Myxococcota bacterium]